MKLDKPTLAIATLELLLCAGTLWHSVAAPLPKPARPTPKTAPTKPTSRPATTKERQAAAQSIRAQLEAFKRDDYATAVRYQSAALKRNFPSVAAFRQMMRATYPQFAAYKSVQFLEARANPKGDHLQMLISLTGTDGTSLRAVYLMVLESKNWRVEGVLGGATQAPQRRPSRPSPPTLTT